MTTFVRRTFIMVLAAFWMAGPTQAQLLRDAEIEQFLADYSIPIFEAAGLPAQSVGIHIVGDPTPNAFVTNGLNMYIHTGLITLADTPNQVEGVIAHEAGHLSGGHQQRSDEAIAAATRPMMLSLVLGTAAALAGSPDAAMAAVSLGQQIGTANYLTYSRGQESAADQAAVTFLEEVGSSGRGLQEFFGKLRNTQLIREFKINPYYTTHPMANSRMTALEERVSQSAFYDAEDSEENLYKFKMIQAKIHGFMQPPHTTLRQYPLSDQSDAAHYARAVAWYRNSELDKALNEINELIDQYPDNPFFHELKGQMLFEHGKAREAIEPHARSVALAPQYALLKINQARAMAATQDRSLHDKTIELLRTALQQEPRNGFGWLELARVYSASGDDTMAALATAEAYYAYGAWPDAHRFATRAVQNLPPNTPAWRQAQDIVNATQDAAIRYQARGGNRQRR